MEKRYTPAQIQRFYRKTAQTYDALNIARAEAKRTGWSVTLRKCRILREKYIEEQTIIAELSKDEEYFSILTLERMKDL